MVFSKHLPLPRQRANQASLDEKIFSVDEFDFQRFQGNEPFSLNLDELIEVYWEAGNKLKTCIGDGRDFLLSAAQEKASGSGRVRTGLLAG
jgi:adenylosuccinate synthase